MQEARTGNPDLNELYAAFNDRDIEAVLANLHPEVDWPNGWEGGRVHGREAVRDYWTRQWAVLNPRVTPVAIVTDPDGRASVNVHAVIRDLEGNIVGDYEVEHWYTFEGGLVRSMEIHSMQIRSGRNSGT